MTSSVANREGFPLSELVQLTAMVQEVILRENSDLLRDARNSQRVRAVLRRRVDEILLTSGRVLGRLARTELVEIISNEIAGYGPIEPLLQEDSVCEIMVNGPNEVYIERHGHLQKTDIRFRDTAHLMEVIGRMIAPLGKRVDRSQPYADGRLPDGSRIHVIIPPLAVQGPLLTIRRFRGRHHDLPRLVQLGTLSPAMADFLARGVAARLNILISGATASGKTTTLNALSAAIVPNAERIVTIEDAAELCLQHEHVVSLETRPPNVEGNGATTMRDLLRNALRMRPDRIIVGEVRGPEAFDMLHAMMTGHDGSLSTVHGNNSVDALVRIENMVLMAGEGLPVSVARYQVANAIDLVVHQVRFADGRRRVMEIAAVAGYRASGEELDKPPYQLWPLFRYQNCVGQAEKESFCLLADGPPPQRLQEKLASRGAGDLFL